MLFSAVILAQLHCVWHLEFYVSNYLAGSHLLYLFA
jgi:hypothetical protein